MKNCSYQEQFREEGYCIIPNAFSSSLFTNFNRALQQILQFYICKISSSVDAPKIIDCNDALIILRKSAPDLISKVQRTISRTPEFFQIASHPIIANSICSLLNLEVTSPLYIISNGIIFSFPFDKARKSINLELEWHKDTFFTIPRNRFLQIWIPMLDDATEQIGTLQICPGSHKDGIGKQVLNKEATFNYRYTMAASEIAKYTPRSISVTLGDLLIFDGRLIHASGKNISNRARVTMLGVIHDATDENFEPLVTEYKYLGETPEEYFYSIFKDENILELIHEQSAYKGEPVGGV